MLKRLQSPSHSGICLLPTTVSLAPRGGGGVPQRGRRLGNEEQWGQSSVWKMATGDKTQWSASGPPKEGPRTASCLTHPAAKGKATELGADRTVLSQHRVIPLPYNTMQLYCQVSVQQQ